MIETVWWEMTGRLRHQTRPTHLADELMQLGVISQAVRYLGPDERKATGASALSRIFPGRGAAGSDSSAILSPLPVPDAEPSLAQWIDMYDDWSIAPDIHPVHRMVAKRAYRALRHSWAPEALVTANSDYIRRRLLPRQSLLVPNGVAEGVGSLPTSGDDDTRLVVLGKLFPGRTDYPLITSVVETGAFSEVLLCGLGESERNARLVDHLTAKLGAGTRVIPWIDEEGLAAVSGRNTVGMIPSVVSDYTLSQDPMKVYLFQALGIRCICPRLLWPKHIDLDFVFLAERGIDLRVALPEWLREPPPSVTWRRDFAHANSWRSRAEAIAGALDV